MISYFNLLYDIDYAYTLHCLLKSYWDMYHVYISLNYYFFHLATGDRWFFQWQQEMCIW